MTSIINDSTRKPKKQKQSQKVYNNRPVEELQETILKNLADCTLANYHRHQTADGQNKENIEDQSNLTDNSPVKTIGDEQPIEDDTLKLPIDRNTLEVLSRKFADEFNCSSLKFDEDTMPTFLIDEWAQREDLQREIFKSFLTSIGFTPPPTSNVRKWNNKAKKKEIDSNAQQLKGNISYIMAEEMAIKESLMHQRHRLKEDNNSYNLKALKDEYKNHGTTLIEDVFIRNDFDYEMTRACLATTIIDSNDYHLQSTAGPKDYYDYTNCWPVFKNEDLNENPLDLIASSYTESCNLKELSDIEIAVKNSVADLGDKRCTLAMNLSLDRLHERFPHISPGHLKLLLFKFNFNERTMSDWLTRNNIDHKQLPMTKNFERPNNNRTNHTKSKSNISIKPTKEEIATIEQAIITARNRLNHLQDMRTSIMRSKQRINASEYYQDEIGACREQLDILQEQHAFAITAYRSMTNSDDVQSFCWSEIDLHGLTWPNSLKVLKSRLVQLRSNKGGSKYLHVVTGRGVNSPSGQGIIKKRLLEYLENKGEKYSFHDTNPGVVLIKV